MFPLDYETVKEGITYIDPAVSDSIYTYQYATVPVDSTLPQVPFEELEELYLDESDPLLLAQSFLLTGNEEEITEYVFKGGLSMAEVQGYDNSVLDELEVEASPTEPCPPGYGWFLVANDNPTPANYHEFVWVCMSLFPPPPSTVNNCGCTIPSNTRYAAGCVRVDYDNSMEPVERAMVVVKDFWFKANMTYTDRNGCWQIGRAFPEKVHVWVVFKNDNVRSLEYDLMHLRLIVRDYYGKSARPHNNISIEYGNGAIDNSSVARKYWASAHALNTVNQYRIQAAADGIPLPRKALNWTNVAGNGGAAAPMLQGNIFNSWPAYLAIEIFPVIYPVVIVPLLPDIVNQYATGERARSFNAVGFHELGHASHYRAVGESYWYDYRNHIINNLGYGTFGSFNPSSFPELVALGEAVGHYVETAYDGILGQGNALVTPGTLTAGGENAEFRENFIPVGLIWDLIDNTPDGITDPNTGLGINDTISGFTRAMVFDALRPNVRSIRAFRDELRTQHLGSTPNTAADFNALLDLYDVFH